MDTQKRIIITEGIKVSVETFYQPEHSHPIAHQYVFSYHITIENMSPYTVQLMRRQWYIFDSNGLVREIEGEGVIGVQPILDSGKVHQYTSWTQLFTDIGKMNGYFLFVREVDGEMFKVLIPEFKLCTPFKLN